LTAPAPAERVSLRRLEELEAAAELDRMCAARPLKPPALVARDLRYRSAGAIELAREIRAGVYTP
jgi:hypothetical protein